MSSEAAWLLVVAALALLVVGQLCWREWRRHQDRVDWWWERDLRRRQEDREVIESRRVGWRGAQVTRPGHPERVKAAARARRGAPSS